MGEAPSLRLYSVLVFKQARKWGRSCCNMLTADKRGVFRLFVCLLACLVVSSRECSRPPVEQQRRNGGLTSPDDAPLSVQYEPTLRFHGALRRHALIRTSREVKPLHPHFTLLEHSLPSCHAGCSCSTHCVSLVFLDVGDVL